MTISIGIDTGKGFHWACAVDETGAVLLSRKVLNQILQYHLSLQSQS